MGCAEYVWLVTYSYMFTDCLAIIFRIVETACVQVVALSLRRKGKLLSPQAVDEIFTLIGRVPDNITYVCLRFFCRHAIFTVVD